VFAAAVILDPDRPIRGLNDSKLLDAPRREVLARRIRERSLAWAIGAVDPFEIDRLNIYHASRLALKRAIDGLALTPDFVLVDGPLTLEVECLQKPLIGGDGRCASIAAASILAKVERDASLRHWDELLPGYALASNKGYSAPDHFRGLDTLGPTPWHRYTFAPVRHAAGLGQQELFV
jgi:ribonuclease HII